MYLKYIIIYFLFSTSLIFSQTIYTFRVPESPVDHRYDYDNALLKLSLEKTLETDGDYILQPSPQMNFKRMNDYLGRGKLINPIFKNTATNENIEDFAYINFPIDLGIVGYRVFFVSPLVREKKIPIKTLEDLKSYLLVQGTGWKDIEILEYSGFKVRTLYKYENLFIEIIKNKADLFPRGINEILDEMNNHNKFNDLSFNNDIILYYPLPRFFFTSKGNEQALDRVQRGLLIAHEDGSLLELWKKYYQESIDFVGIEGKIILEIDNPLISNIDKSYEKYIYRF